VSSSLGRSTKLKESVLILHPSSSGNPLSPNCHVRSVSTGRVKGDLGEQTGRVQGERVKGERLKTTRVKGFTGRMKSAR
jgi:hypothetical protein